MPPLISRHALTRFMQWTGHRGPMSRAEKSLVKWLSRAKPCRLAGKRAVREFLTHGAKGRFLTDGHRVAVLVPDKHRPGKEYVATFYEVTRKDWVEVPE